MNIHPYLLLAFGIVMNASANILVKIGVSKIARVSGGLISLATTFIKEPVIVLSMALFGGSFAVYTLALTKLNLSVAYPLWVSVSFLGIVLFSVFSLGEKVTVAQAAGFAAILIGIWLVTYQR